jgi:hypothetical protein
MPQIEPNFTAVAVAVLVNFFLGFAWYSRLFGKVWHRELGLPEDHAATGAALAKGLFANLFGCFVLALVLGNNIQAWTPSVWGIAGTNPDPIGQALQAAFFTFLGFVVPPLLNGLAWEKRSLKLSAINGGYTLSSLTIAALIMTHLR